MLSISNISKAHASNYYSHGDYHIGAYSSEWFGKGKDILGIKKYSKEEFELLLDGKHIKEDNTTILSNRNNRAVGIDLTFSAPKSVSIMAELKDKKIFDIHKMAVKNTLKYIENNFVFSRTKDGEFKKEDSMIATLFTEDTSRELDPQLHTHCVLHNYVFDSDGKTKSAYFKDIFNNKKYLGAIYRNELARGLKETGYSIVPTKNGFEIEGVSKKLCDLFSTRRKQIEEALKEKGGITDGKDAAKATLNTRKSKQKNIDEKALLETWKEKAKAFNLENLKTNDFQPKNLDSKIEIQKSIDSLMERNAVLNRQDIIKYCIDKNLGNFSIENMEKSIQKSTNYYYNTKTREYTTFKQYATEQDIVQKMQNCKDKFSSLISNKQLEDIKKNHKILYSSLTYEKKNLVDFVLTNKDQFIAVQGYAGVGKTYTIKALNEILNKNNYEIVGLAPTSSAVNTLKNEIPKIEAKTLQSFLRKYDGYANGRGTEESLNNMKEVFKNKIILLDESSLADTQQIHKLFTIAEKFNTRVILQGDKMQLDAVNAGSPFKQLQEKGMEKAEIKDIVRQKNTEIKQAVYDVIGKKTASAFKRLKNYIQEVNVKNVETAAQRDMILVNKLVEKYKSLGEEEKRNTLFIIPNNDTKDMFERIINRETKNEEKIKTQENTNFIKKMFGKLDNIKEMKTTVLKQKSLTKVEKADIRNFNLKDTIIFNKDYKNYNIMKDTEYKIIDFQENKAVCEFISQHKEQNETNKDKNNSVINGLITIDVGKAKNFEVFEDKKINLFEGETLKITANDKRFNLTKNDEITLNKIKDDKIHFSSKNQDFVVSKDDYLMKKLDYNFATTAHSAQGKTYKNAVVLLESYRTNLTSQKAFYVELSRVKDNITIFTDDKNKTLNLLEKNTGDRANALDIFDKERTQNLVNEQLIIKNDKDKSLDL